MCWCSGFSTAGAEQPRKALASIAPCTTTHLDAVVHECVYMCVHQVFPNRRRARRRPQTSVFRRLFRSSGNSVFVLAGHAPSHSGLSVWHDLASPQLLTLPWNSIDPSHMPDVCASAHPRGKLQSLFPRPNRWHVLNSLSSAYYIALTTLSYIPPFCRSEKYRRAHHTREHRTPARESRRHNP